MAPVVPEQIGFSSSRLERINTAFQAHVDQGRLPGAVTLIARRGKIVHEGCFGWRNIENRQPMRMDTLFPIYSMTKPVLAVAIMILYEEGRFQLSDPLSKYLPAFKHVKVVSENDATGFKLVSSIREITIYDLLTQTAGMPTDMWPLPGLEKLLAEVDLHNPESTLQELTQKLAGIPLVHQPGMGFRYGDGPEILGYLVELISGMPIGDFFKTRIFDPLGMVDTSYDVPEEKKDRLSTLYGLSETGGFIQKAEISRWLSLSSRPRGGFGLFSTAPDYLRFCQMLLNQGELDGVQILGRMTVEYMTRNHLPKELVPIEMMPGFYYHGYGYGFLMGVLVDALQAKMLGSEGELMWGGINGTIFNIDPKEEFISLLMLDLDVFLGSPFYYEMRTLTCQAIVG